MFRPYRAQPFGGAPVPPGLRPGLVCRAPTEPTSGPHRHEFSPCERPIAAKTYPERKAFAVNRYRRCLASTPRSGAVVQARASDSNDPNRRLYRLADHRGSSLRRSAPSPAHGTAQPRRGVTYTARGAAPGKWPAIDQPALKGRDIAGQVARCPRGHGGMSGCGRYVSPLQGSTIWGCTRAPGAAPRAGMSGSYRADQRPPQTRIQPVRAADWRENLSRAQGIPAKQVLPARLRADPPREPK